MYFILNYFSCCEKPKPGARKLAQWMHVLAAKPDNVGSVLRSRIVGETQLSPPVL